MTDAGNHSESTDVVLATFDHPEDAAAALGDLLAAGFLNIEQEVEDERTELVVDPGGREDEVRKIVAKHRGVEINLPH